MDKKKKRKKRVAVVTGASSGVGYSTALALSERGYTVIGLARRVNKMTFLAATSNGDIYPKYCDLTKEEDIEEAFTWIDSTFERVDVLVNCAGVLKKGGITGGEVTDWKTLFDVNVIGLSLCCRRALKTMRKTGDAGYIININSHLGHCVPQHFDIGMYSATKHAITAITENLKNELRRLESKIRVASVSPGSVYTEMSQRFRAEAQGIPFDEKLSPGYLPKRYLGPEDVATAVMYILNAPTRVQINDICLEAVDHERV